MKISLLIPCYVDQLFPRIGISMVHLFERLGHEVDYPEGQTCCGQPAYTAGCWHDARAVAGYCMDQFRDAQAVVVPSGSCAAMVKSSNLELFKRSHRLDDAKSFAARTWEFSDFLVNKLQVLDVDAQMNARVTFHDGCSGLRELGLKEQPRKLLRHVRGLELVEMDEAETCCGFGGTFSMKFSQISTAMMETKYASILKTNADAVVSNDPSCLMQIRGYFERQQRPMRCLHLSEVLEASS